MLRVYYSNMPQKTLKIVTHKSIKLADRDVPYKLIISTKARRLSLKIGQKSGLEVVVPRRANLSAVPRFIHEKEAWVIKHLREIDRKKRTARKNAFKDGAIIQILDSPRKVRIVTTPKKNHVVKEQKIIKYAKDYAYYDGYEFVIYLSRHRMANLPNQTEKARLEEARGALEKHLRKRARAHFLRRTAELADWMDLKYNRIAIKNHTSRWGSCSRDKNLNFNWRLIMTRAEIVDSIIIHELCHLRHMNHGKRFYSLLETYCPNHKDLSKELAETIFPLDLRC